MNVRTILWLVGIVSGAVALSQTLELAVAVALGEPWLPFTNTIGAGLELAALFILPARRYELRLGQLLTQVDRELEAVADP